MQKGTVEAGANKRTQ